MYPRPLKTRKVVGAGASGRWSKWAAGQPSHPLHTIVELTLAPVAGPHHVATPTPVIRQAALATASVACHNVAVSVCVP